jgi:glycosyltransferase involved in cell wall biosynthesis
MTDERRSANNNTLSVDLIWINGARAPSVWPLGAMWTSDASPAALSSCLERALSRSKAEAFLFWDSALGDPDAGIVEKVASLPGDVWHAGLRLGMSGLPRLLASIFPTWMFTADPDRTIEATSWRVSLRACLTKREVLLKMGGVRPEFGSLDAASLEMGHRYLTRGVIVRHVPWLLHSLPASVSAAISIEDEVRFAFCRFGKRWALWGIFRAIMLRRLSLPSAFSVWFLVSRSGRPANPSPYRKGQPDFSIRTGSVTVLIPTLERYPYLRKLLTQLRVQTVPPLEITIVDQTPKERREEGLASEFADLPITMIYSDLPGQCSSRNAGLQKARGEYILFLDDDDEVKPDLIAAHLHSIQQFQAQASCGVADELGAGQLPEDFTFLRVSDVFPTNNTMIRRDALLPSGLFDLAYERGQRADGDLGMRIYLSGALMILNPSISVLHHHAPSGGLRVHKARVVTYASSRKRMTHRQLPSATEVYLASRFFPPGNLKEMLWLAVFGTFSMRGNMSSRLIKAFLGSVLLPDTMWKTRKQCAVARQMMDRFPKIPSLNVLPAGVDENLLPFQGGPFTGRN